MWLLLLLAPAQPPVVNKVPPPIVNRIPTERQVAPVGYRWEKWPGEDWKLVGVAPSAPFRDPHACPACGRLEFRAQGWNRDGTHRHRCPVDGSVWSH